MFALKIKTPNSIFTVMKFIQVFLEAQNLMSAGFKLNKYVKFNVTQKISNPIFDRFFGNEKVTNRRMHSMCKDMLISILVCF